MAGERDGAAHWLLAQGTRPLARMHCPSRWRLGVRPFDTLGRYHFARSRAALASISSTRKPAISSSPRRGFRVRASLVRYLRARVLVCCRTWGAVVVILYCISI
eukprot:scaffold23348_cov35-Tisochrysis_lutea.AAC.2